MFLTITFLTMLISSISIIVFTNHLTSTHKKESESQAIKQKFTKFQHVKVVKVDEPMLEEAY